MNKSLGFDSENGFGGINDDGTGTTGDGELE